MNLKKRFKNKNIFINTVLLTIICIIRFSFCILSFGSENFIMSFLFYLCDFITYLILLIYVLRDYNTKKHKLLILSICLLLINSLLPNVVSLFSFDFISNLFDLFMFSMLLIPYFMFLYCINNKFIYNVFVIIFLIILSCLDAGLFIEIILSKSNDVLYILSLASSYLCNLIYNVVLISIVLNGKKLFKK